MPRSLRALLFTVFLIVLALFIIILFMSRTKSELDAQSYTEQHLNCNEIKIHSKKNDLVECFLNFESNSDFPAELQGADSFYIPMAKFIGEKFPEEFPLRIMYIFSFPGKTPDSIGISGKTLNITKNTNSAWRNKNTGCRFPGPCPIMPLKGSVIPQKFAREDYNAERIFRTKFSAIGEAPVNAILPGKILQIEQDSLFTVTIYHGENIYSKTNGLSRLNEDILKDSIISADIAFGFLPPLDTAFIFTEITRNGKYELWEDFYRESRE